MRLISIIIVIVLGCSSCDKRADEVELKGSWYFDFGEWGPIDTTINYSELYFGDSSYYVQNEAFGQMYHRLYLVTPDSIYYGDDSTDLEPYYKIIKLQDDTLWLKANPKILKKWDTVFYVKFPRNEYGHFDLRWTLDNRDSLREKVVYDYNRRMWKYHLFKSGDIRVFDSLDNVGYWKWSMKDVRGAEAKERKYHKKAG